MMHGILVVLSIANIIILIINGNYFYTAGWVCCLFVTVSNLYKIKKIKSLEKSIINTRNIMHTIS